MDGYLLGIDIGTYESKAVITTTAGEVVSKRKRLNRYNRNDTRFP